jgi:hypothetical protein
MATALKNPRSRRFSKRGEGLFRAIGQFVDFIGSLGVRKQSRGLNLERGEESGTH